MDTIDLGRALDEIEARNRDNLTRTASYLALYAWTRAHPPELPWLLMAHLVSRNTGYLLGDLATRAVERRASGDEGTAGAIESLALLLERGNRVIFDDAWRHVVAHLRRRAGLADVEVRASAWVRAAWERYEREGGERRLVLDLVHNEQNVIERRVVHHPRFAPGLRLLQLIEASGRERPLHFPVGEAAITVGGFAELERRILAGRRIFDEVVAPRRDDLFAWAQAHPHTGSRAVYGGRPGPSVPEAWPAERLVALDPTIHEPLEDDPLFP